ncbi:MAG: S-layer homology domain-containing protein, partial [Clostridia bacterium]|nr:S-layer homology domain-containing protein [Clostridia bacterium]
MKNFKKVVAGLLALLMLALSVNVTFAAEEYNDAEAVAVAKVNAAGIMQGTDKGFEPAKTLTRAEAAAIMVRMKGI